LIDFGFGHLDENVRGAEKVGVTFAVSGTEGEISMKLVVPPQKRHEEARPRSVFPLKKPEGTLTGAIEEGAFGQISDGLVSRTAPAIG
jgi:hypothetical protein